jgi:hypothetical protein
MTFGFLKVMWEIKDNHGTGLLSITEEKEQYSIVTLSVPIGKGGGIFVSNLASIAVDSQRYVYVAQSGPDQVKVWLQIHHDI